MPPPSTPETAKARLAKLKEDVVRHYSKGSMRCAHCGTTTRLGIDHIRPVPRPHHRRRRGTRRDVGPNLWRRLKREGFPRDYQVLCKACNSSKGRDAVPAWKRRINGASRLEPRLDLLRLEPAYVRDNPETVKRIRELIAQEPRSKDDGSAIEDAVRRLWGEREDISVSMLRWRPLRGAFFGIEEKDGWGSDWWSTHLWELVEDKELSHDFAEFARKKLEDRGWTAQFLNPFARRSRLFRLGFCTICGFQKALVAATWAVRMGNGSDSLKELACDMHAEERRTSGWKLEPYVHW